MRSARQQEAYEWLGRLEVLAMQNNVKLRLLDAIRDCKKDLEPELTEAEWRQKCVEIEELLEQLKKQIDPQTEMSELETDVAQRILEILDRCRTSNEMLQSEYSGGSAFYIQEAENALQEMTNVKANYAEVTDQERLQGVFLQISQRYKQQIDEQQERYIKAVDRSYQESFDRLKGLLSATGVDEEANRKFYRTYYANQDSLTRTVQEYAHRSEKGESCIVKLAEELRMPLAELFAKLKKRAAFLKWLPALILVICIAIFLIHGWVKSSGEATETAAKLEDVMQRLEDGSEMNVEDILAIAAAVINQGADVIAAAGIEKAIKAFILAIGIPLLLLIILLYFLWCKAVNKRRRSWIIKQAGEILAVSVSKFRGENTLQLAAQESYRQVGAYMQSQYEGMLSELIPDLVQENDHSEKSAFAMLYDDWSDIRRKVV